MTHKLVEIDDREELLAEVSRLHGEVRRLEERIALLDTLAHQDALIELPNRRGFMRQLELLIGRVTRYGDSAAMLYVDIDGLKLINDMLGHEAGDKALMQVAELLSGGIRKEDCVARLGGDEFGILLAHANEAIAEETARRLIDRVADSSFSWDGETLPLSVAIGVAAIEAGDQPQAVICQADKAMYRQKAAA